MFADIYFRGMFAYVASTVDRWAYWQVKFRGFIYYREYRKKFITRVLPVLKFILHPNVITDPSIRYYIYTYVVRAQNACSKLVTSNSSYGYSNNYSC